jgi:hypothetical protein
VNFNTNSQLISNLGHGNDYQQATMQQPVLHATFGHQSQSQNQNQNQNLIKNSQNLNFPSTNNNEFHSRHSKENQNIITTNNQNIPNNTSTSNSMLHQHISGVVTGNQNINLMNLMNSNIVTSTQQHQQHFLNNFNGFSNTTDTVPSNNEILNEKQPINNPNINIGNSMNRTLNNEILNLPVNLNGSSKVNEGIGSRLNFDGNQLNQLNQQNVQYYYQNQHHNLGHLSGALSPNNQYKHYNANAYNTNVVYGKDYAREIEKDKSFEYY